MRFTTLLLFGLSARFLKNGFSGAKYKYLERVSVDKLIEVYEENKQLYERLVQAEKEKVEFLEKILKGK